MSEYLNNWDIAKGVAEVALETVRRAGAGVIHLATQQFQHETPSTHHFDHPITDRPATYNYPAGSEGEYYGEQPPITAEDLLPPEAA